jgi:2-hydroxychromene-2-carboxylate isomerase
MREIEYFYSAHSAYAYLGSARFMAIAAEANRVIVHKPYELNKGVIGVGSTSTRSRPDNHRAYYFGREIERWAEYREAPVVSGMPTHHWNDMTIANCLIIAAGARGAEADALAHAMLQAHWRDDADLADEGTLKDLMRGAGLDAAALMNAARGADALASYEANTREAIERSVFGSPTYIVDGDMFYGQDHLEMVERALRQPFAGSWPRA